MTNKDRAFCSPPSFNSVVDDKMFNGGNPVNNRKFGYSKNVDLMLSATHNEASLLHSMLPKTPLVHSVLSFVFCKVLTRMVIPMELQGILGTTKSSDTELENGACKI